MIYLPPVVSRTSILAIGFAAMLGAGNLGAATLGADGKQPSPSWNGESDPLLNPQLQLGEGKNNSIGGAGLFGEGLSDKPSVEIQQAIGTLFQTGSDAALAQLRGLLDDSPQNAGGWAFLAIWSAENKRIDLANEANAKAVQLNPHNPLTQLSSAVLQQISGDVDGAITSLSQILANNPSNINAAARLSGIYVARGQVSNAVVTLEALISRTGTNASTAS